MSDDLIEPEVPIPVADPLSANPVRPSDARLDRPGIHINPPAATDEQWKHHAYQSMQIEQVLAQVRYLRRVSMRPGQDPSWPHLRDQMIEHYAGLESRAATNDLLAIHQAHEIEHLYAFITHQRLAGFCDGVRS